jgi:drug/metabolite transporter (DMT)-like permease
MKKSKLFKGEIFALVAALSYSTFGIFTRSLKDDFSPIFRTVSVAIPSAALTFMLWILLTKSSSRKVDFRNKRYWFINMISGGIVNVFFFLSTTHLNLALTMFIFYGTSLAITYLFSRLIHKETVDQKEKLGFIFAITGLFVLNIDLIKSFSLIHMVYPVIAGGFFGIKQNTGKVISKSNSPFLISTLGYLTSFFVLAPFIFIFSQEINTDFTSKAWGINLLYALIGVVATVATVFAFKYSEATKANLILLSELIFVILFGFIFYNESLSFTGIIGSLLILFAQIVPHINTKVLNLKRDDRPVL